MMQLIEISMHKEEIDFLQQHARVEVSVTQKNAMQQMIQKVLRAIGNGSYTREQVLSWETEIFQKKPIYLTRKELDEILDEVNELPGGDTHFSEDNKYGNYREACYEQGGYNQIFQNIIEGKNISRVSLSEAVKRYDAEVEKTFYTGMFAPYLCDKLGRILCLSASFVLAVFQICLSSGTRDMLAMRSISTIKFLGIKYASMVFTKFLPVFLLIVITNIKVCLQGM